MTDSEQHEYEFDIAVSFAGENREYVSEVVDAVKGDMKVFYDQDYEAEAWGEDGVEYFTKVYMNRARYVVLFVSQHYAMKMWTNVERRSALARAATQRSAYILPVRLDDTQLDGLLPTVIYLDSRRIGIEGLINAIRTKISGTAPARPSSALLDGRVPRSQEAIEALMTERTGYWEYLLYGGLLRANMDKLEPKYQDFVMGYARRNGRRLSRDELIDFTQAAISAISAITENFNMVLDAGVQERAFGKPGEPGDVDRIVHMAEKFISVYEDFMDWAADLRGTSAQLGGGAGALRALSRWAEQPVEECRRFVRDFVAELDTVEKRVEAGEQVRIVMPVTLEMDPAISAEFHEKLRAAFEDDD
ncbi:TIR domain-containing protein [Occultella kanbiaonis]|uniref:TIR domain-containing protein n=1 Tax=Occultella kanbiaonis TaxID=2675754 RepID=UPI0012B7D769|nr:TIR domain-containing protein [Occultella kanbiaonis]